MLDSSNFYVVHWITPNDDATDFTRKLMGKFVIEGDRIEILSDYHNFLHRIIPEKGIIDEKVRHRLDTMFHSSYLQVTRKSDVGHAAEPVAPDPQPEPDAPAQMASKATTKPPAVFDYQRAGMEKPHTIEIQGGKMFLDGSLLTEEEAKTVVKNAQTGAATLRYKTNRSPPAPPVQAAEDQAPEAVPMTHDDIWSDAMRQR